MTCPYCKAQGRGVVYDFNEFGEGSVYCLKCRQEFPKIQLAAIINKQNSLIKELTKNRK